MSFSSSSKRLKLSTFKLNALLSMAQAISGDMRVEDLLERFRSILNDDLGIDRVLFFKCEEKWELILSTNCSESISNQIDVERDLINLTDISFVSTSQVNVLQEFDIIIPVIQNNVPLAYILIADTKEEAKGVSATIKHLNFVQTLSIIIFVAIENLRLFHKTLEQEAMKKELELASKMQGLLIPNQELIPQSNELRIYSYYQPHFEVGGDFYDIIPLGRDEVGFCIADVSGKGISAAILMSNFQANLRALFTHDITLTGLIEKLNERVMGTAKGERFITIFIGRYNKTRKTLEYINAGHNPPILYNKQTKQIEMLKNGCVGLGMLDEIPIMNMGSVRITQPSKLFCYTDGLVEFTENDKVEFNTSIIEDYIKNDNSIEQNVGEIINTRVREEREKKIGIFDDISILAFEFF
ncbi:MAG TPA: SpoIIE family protein phosphatase [Tenuifilaceae bacterium]|nr:SpoIIE family protein phosphatase [Tenuifilaceae bacterium]HPE17024.1 SpoIIE family protein phosphatase [Tenuifilaceae bacterium]HPJ44691.1 SpoIIE family protein phosphatase [Tenuifilaceae bacterium]HPQ32955.1 SpoIIE family protein phosphatase [Tenuifilaceae bacterium]HRX66773.1 SpoIIE family protein phosphatase [Tenuifilaceae bacterium]